MGADEASAKRKKRAKRSGGGMGTLLFLLAPASIFALPTALITLIGMIPTVVAHICDRDPDKTAPICVGAINICGILPFVMDLWKHQHTMQAAMKLLGDPFTWLVMYGAAAVGWGFYYLIPPIVTNFEVTMAEGRIESLLKKRRELMEEWGGEVAMDDEQLLEFKTKQQQAQGGAPAAAQGGGKAEPRPA